MTEQQNEFIDSFSRYELVEMYYSGMNLASVQVSILITVLFAYFALSYFAAKKLGTFEVVAITIIYSAFYLQVLQSYFAGVGFLNAMIVALFDRSILWNVYAFSSVLLVGWASSLYYMYRERHENDT